MLVRYLFVIVIADVVLIPFVTVYICLFVVVVLIPFVTVYVC